MSWIDENNNILLSQKSLDFLWEKQRIISENLANIDTPGYKSKLINFEDELERNLDRFKGQTLTKKAEIREAINNTKIRVDVNNEEGSRLDGNNVNTDEQQVELLRAQLQYQYQISQINDQFRRLRIAIGKNV